MAKRPVFSPKIDGLPYVDEILIEFRWHPGFSVSQARKSIRSLHKEAEMQGVFPILEISGKSESPLGKSLSAFELTLDTPSGQTTSVESAFQGSKVFERDGPFHELYSVSGREAKTDRRLRNSGEVVAFNFFGKEFPIEPQTAFYDWIYMTALSQLESSPVRKLEQYKAFSDIAFNPKLSINCQARSAAVFVALNHCMPDMVQNLSNWDSYMQIITGSKKLSSAEQSSRQLGLPME